MECFASQFAQHVDGMHLIVTRRVVSAISTQTQIDTGADDATKLLLVTLLTVVLPTTQVV